MFKVFDFPIDSAITALRAVFPTNKTKFDYRRMPLKRRFKDKYAGSSPENASVVRTLFDLF